MRYLILLLLNIPIILAALLSIVTQYKLKKASKQRFRHQIILWSILLIVLVCSFPAYNLLSGRPILDSHELSLFDIVQTTAIIVMIYVLNRHRQTIEANEKRIQDLHKELSIRISEDENVKG